jgi:hypothetical protein
MTTSGPIQSVREWRRNRRARHLTSPRFRAELAASIRNLLDAAEVPPRGYTAAAPIQREAILAERELLLEIAADLESDDELKPRGVALVERLLVDGSSPVYAGGTDRALHGAVVQARAALHLS